MAVAGERDGDGSGGVGRKALARLEALIWILIYGGLLTIIVGMVMARNAPGSGDLMLTAGGTAAIVGVVLIYVRSRLREKKP